MNINSHGQVSITASELFETLYSDKRPILSQVKLTEASHVLSYNNSVTKNCDKFDLISLHDEFIGTTLEFDQKHTKIWFIPESYKNLDIAEWLIKQCKDNNELDRVCSELELFIQYDMIMVLIYLKYIVDTMRTHKIVWGVGRGSSVASYCLYLIGVHKINSMLYELDIREFLK
jgi:DNA polymerase III alpha subunit